MSADEVRFLADAIKELDRKQDEISGQIAELGKTLVRMEGVHSSLAELQVRVRTLEDLLQQAKGAKWTFGALLTGAAFLGGGVGAKIAGLFAQTK